MARTEAATALSNLRVNLTHLHGVLQPGRGGGVLPWFVRSDGDWLILADDGVTSTRTCSTSGSDMRDRWTTPVAAPGPRGLRGSDRARSRVLDDWPDAPWAHFERLRLRAASMARCRLELLLASGEPEQASQLAEGVLRHSSRCRSVRAACSCTPWRRRAIARTAFRVAGALVDSLVRRGSARADTDAMVRGYGVLPA